LKEARAVPVESSQVRVLVVDDDGVTRLLVAKRLGKMNATVVQAEDGIAGFATLRREPIDLAIVDLEMPGMDGFQLLGCIRGMPKLKHLPVIVLTGAPEASSIHRALASGATSVLFKPINWEVFERHLECLLNLVGGVSRQNHVDSQVLVAVASG
jgi:CheY-like chemotaxis protein